MPSKVDISKQKTAYEIDEVPVEAGDLHRHVVAVFEVTSQREHCQHQHEDNTDSNMNRVQPGHGKIEPEKNLRRTSARFVPLKTGTRHEAINEVFVILEA